ncbi:MAG: hypothetical protein ACQCN6_00010 [Candidatus Bathyarchaeia archaeon]
MSLKRDEAIRIIQEIDEECKDIRGSSLMLMEPNQSSVLSKGYQVHIKMKVTPSRLRCVETIAQQYGYQVNVSSDNWLVIIYRPTKRSEMKPVEHGRA